MFQPFSHKMKTVKENVLVITSKTCISQVLTIGTFSLILDYYPRAQASRVM